MQILLTAFALACAVVAFAAMLRCMKAIDTCEELVSDMAKHRARVLGNEAAVERLSAQVKQITGRVYAQSRRAPVTFDADTEEPLEGDDEVQAMLALQNARPVKPGQAN